MASEHIVKLKAVLDASGVKAQLNGMQGAGSASGSGISQQAQLVQALNNLNASLGTLNRQVQQSNKEGGANSTLMKSAKWLAGGQVLGTSLHGLSEYYSASGNQSGAKLVGGLQNIASGMMSGAAFGAKGAVIGAAAGSLKTAFEMLADSARKSAMALEAERAQRTQDAIQQRRLESFGRNWKFSKSLENMDMTTLGKEIAAREEKLGKLSNVPKDTLQKLDDKIIEIVNKSPEERSKFGKQRKDLERQRNDLLNDIQSLPQVQSEYQQLVARRSQLQEEEDRKKAEKEAAQQAFNEKYVDPKTGKLDFSDFERNRSAVERNRDSYEFGAEYGAEYIAGVLKNETQRQKDLLGQQEWQLDTLLKGIRENQAMSGLGAIGGHFGESVGKANDINQAVKEANRQLQRLIDLLKPVSEASVEKADVNVAVAI